MSYFGQAFLFQHLLDLLQQGFCKTRLSVSTRRKEAQFPADLCPRFSKHHDSPSFSWNPPTAHKNSSLFSCFPAPLLPPIPHSLLPWQSYSHHCDIPARTHYTAWQASDRTCYIWILLPLRGVSYYDHLPPPSSYASPTFSSLTLLPPNTLWWKLNRLKKYWEKPSRWAGNHISSFFRKKRHKIPYHSYKQNFPKSFFPPCTFLQNQL